MLLGLHSYAHGDSVGSGSRARWGLESELSTVLSQKVPNFGKWIVEPRAHRLTA
jgi:hypothetical protein